MDLHRLEELLLGDSPLTEDDFKEWMEIRERRKREHAEWEPLHAAATEAERQSSIKYRAAAKTAARELAILEVEIKKCRVILNEYHGFNQRIKEHCAEKLAELEATYRQCLESGQKVDDAIL
mmetsp:Transcript_35257/g.46422  ORF Transcript_35257/g.46422 Transcript_35257/m.46422 type:complete len:122 (-) Transcript_35257:247-612(-)